MAIDLKKLKKLTNKIWKWSGVAWFVVMLANIFVDTTVIGIFLFYFQLFALAPMTLIALALLKFRGTPNVATAGKVIDEDDDRLRY